MSAARNVDSEVPHHSRSSSISSIVSNAPPPTTDDDALESSAGDDEEGLRGKQLSISKQPQRVTHYRKRPTKDHANRISDSDSQSDSDSLRMRSLLVHTFFLLHFTISFAKNFELPNRNVKTVLGQGN